MSSDGTSGAPFAEHRQSIFGGVYRLLSKIDRTRLTAAYWVADEVDDQYLLIEFLNRAAADESGATTPEAWQISGGPTLSDFLEIVEKLSRLRHPNIEPMLQFFEDNGTGYAVVQSRITKSLADEIDRNAFFHQPPEILAASQDLVEAVAYCTAMRIENVDLSPDAVSIDDDGGPMISIRHFLEDMLEAKGDGQAPDLAYGASQCMYAMMTGVIPEARHVRKHMVASGQVDPVVRTADLDLPFPAGVRKSVDIALARDGMTQAEVLAWTRNFGSDAQVEEPAPAPEQPKRKRRGSVVGALVGAGALTAAVFAFVTFKDDLLAGTGVATSAPTVEVSIPQGGDVAQATQPAAVAEVEPETTVAPEVTEVEVAAAPEVTEPATPEPVAALQPSAPASEASVPEVAEVAEVPEVAAQAPAPASEEPSETPVAASEETTEAASEQSARRQVSAADLEAVLRDLAGGSATAPAPAAPASEDTAPAQATVEPEQTEQAVVALAEATQPEQAEDQVAIAAPAADDPAESASQPEQAAVQPTNQGTVDTFATNAVTGITWRVADRLGHEVIAQEGEAAFLRLRSLDNHFSFVTKNPWYARNSEIRNFGDQNVDREFSLQDALHSHFANSDQPTPLIDVMVSYDGSAPEAAKVDVPIEATRSFGPIRIAQRSVAGGWSLFVDQVQSPSINLRAGDRIMSVSGKELSQGTISQLMSMVEAEAARGGTDLEVSVRRGLSGIVVVSVDLDDL